MNSSRQAQEVVVGEGLVTGREIQVALQRRRQFARVPGLVVEMQAQRSKLPTREPSDELASEWRAELLAVSFLELAAAMSGPYAVVVKLVG